MHRTNRLAALIVLLLSTLPIHEAKAKGKCVEDKAEQISSLEKGIRQASKQLKDEDIIETLAKQLKSAGYFPGHEDLTAIEIKNKTRAFMSSQLEQAKTSLLELKSKKDCSEPGSRKECIENKSSRITQYRQQLSEAAQTLDNPQKLIILAENLRQSGQLPANLSDNQKISAAKRFINSFIENTKADIASKELQPDCAIFEYPFRLDPRSFEEYLNSTDWEDNKKRVFMNLSKCDSYHNNGFKSFGCDYGYIKIEDPVLGRRLCEIRSHSGHAVYFADGKVSHGYLGPCRILK